MRLRIAHVANEPFGVNVASGVQQVVYCLARAQADLGESVAIFTRDDRAMHVFGEDEGSRPMGRGWRRLGFGSTLRARLLARYFEPALAAKLLAWGPDVVHFHSIHVPENVALATHLRRARIPYCVTAHGGLFPAALQRTRLKKAVFTRLFELQYLNAAQFIHALSPREAEVIRRHQVRQPIVVVPNGLPPESGLSASDPDALYRTNPGLRGRSILMFIGRLDPWQKGLDLLLRAFAQARLSDAALVLVGPDHRGSRAVLQALAGRLDIAPQTVFLAPAFGQDRANLLAAADVFVHPSRWEGLSLSVLAAAAAGKPCLLTHEADPLGEFERAEGAILVDANVASITDGLQTAIGLSRDDLRRMGARARRAVDGRFSWPRSAQQIIQAYRTGADGSPPGIDGLVSTTPHLSS